MIIFTTIVVALTFLWVSYFLGQVWLIEVPSATGGVIKCIAVGFFMLIVLLIVVFLVNFCLGFTLGYFL